MLLSKAHKILKKKFKGDYCTVRVETDGFKQGSFKWTVYADRYHHHSGPSFSSAFNKLLNEVNPKRVKHQDVEVK